MIFLVCWLLCVGPAEAEVPLQRPKSMQDPEPSPPQDATPEPAPEPNPEPPVEPPREPPPEAPREPPAPADEASSCPCDPVDWRCWQAHLDVCHFTPRPAETRAPAPAPAPAPPPRERPREPEVAPPPPGEDWPVDATRDVPPDPTKPRYGREGFVIGLGIGAQICPDGWCDELGFDVGPHGRLELGYRHRLVFPTLTVSAGGDTNDWRDDLARDFGSARARTTFVDAGIGVQIHPIPRGRLDPFCGARIGLALAHTRVRSSQSNWTLEQTVRRGGVGLSGGLIVHVTDLVSMGPRFDVMIPFSGEMCSELRQGTLTEHECIAVKDFEEPEMLNSSELPLPAAFTAEVRITIPVRGR